MNAPRKITVLVRSDLLHKLDRILMGDLDELTDALMADKRYRQLDDG